MSTTPPLLDNRALHDILQRLQELASIDVPTWRPPREGDAGTMLQRIFARLLELALQRLNRVPEKHLLAFLDTMGVSLLPPSPAQVPLTFTLTPGTPPTLVPQGTQAGTQPSVQQPAVVFATDDDLTVIPAQLTMGFTMDPRWDRYTDQTPRLGGRSAVGFTPFVGTWRMPHRLYVGDDLLLTISREAQVEIRIHWHSKYDLAAVKQFLQNLSYQYSAQGKTLGPPAVVDGDPLCRQFTLPEPFDQETIQGVGLPQGLTSRWLQIDLTTPFPDAPVAHDLQLHQLQLRVSADCLLPDFAFSNTGPVDVTKDFFPFGEIPKVGDAFYLANAEAFAKAGATVTMRYKVRPLPPPKLIWEYFDAALRQWLPIGIQSDHTAALTQGGAIRGSVSRMGITTINGTPGYWVRVRLIEGGYARLPKIKTFHIQAQGGSRRPPRLGFANQDRIDFNTSFLPFGAKPSPSDFFYFGELPDSGDLQMGVIDVQVELDPDLSDIPSPTDLRWECLGKNGWAAIPGFRDTTAAFRQAGDGTVTFTMPEAVRQEVHGQASYWVRVRIADGDYGRPTEFVPVDPDDPTKGFKPRPGTGNVQPPQLQSLTLDYTAERTPTVLMQNGFLYSDQTLGNTTTAGFTPFISVQDLTPRVYADAEPAFYLGWDAAFPEQPVTLYVPNVPRAFAGSVIKNVRAAPIPSLALPPLRWEYFNGTAWRELMVFDGTNNLTESGVVKFLTPTDVTLLAKFDLTARYWLRARSSANDPFDTQRLLGVFLNATPAVQAVTVPNEMLGSSNGLPSQTLRFVRTPVLPGQAVLVRESEPPSGNERIALEEEEGKDAVQEHTHPTTGETEILIRWHEVANFLQSDPHRRHYTLDHTSGLLTFGDGKHGVIPSRGTNNIIVTYRTGGGTVGNVPQEAVAQVESPLPGVAAVVNPVAADGGAAAETVPMVQVRGPQTLKHRGRAVACADLEWLARQAAGTRVARAKCLPNVNRDLRFEPGWVTLLIIPQGTAAKLSPSAELIRAVEDYLEAHAFAGLVQQTPARVNIIGPGYIQIMVVAEVVPRDIDAAAQVKQRVHTALTGFFHPLTGGPHGTGWEFARDVYASEVYQLLEGVSGVSHVKQLQVIPHIAQHRFALTSAPIPALDLPEGSVVMTTDRHKAAFLAEPVPPGTAVERIAVKGFKEGDRIAKVHDLIVTSTPPGGSRDITVQSFDSDACGLPLGSLVTTFDGVQRTRLAVGISPSAKGLVQVVVEDDDFAAQLQPGDVLTVFYPFPMIVTSVALETVTSAGATPVQTLGIGSYDLAAAFPAGSVLATLDNRVRMPLAVSILAGQTVTSLQVLDFAKNDALTILRRDGAAPPLRVVIQEVELATDIVYLDENFLVHSGNHRIMMVAE